MDNVIFSGKSKFKVVGKNKELKFGENPDFEQENITTIVKHGGGLVNGVGRLVTS